MSALDSLIPIANDLLTQFGQAVTIHQPGASTYDTATGTTTTSPPTDHLGNGVEENYSAFSIASGFVQAGDVKFLLSGLKTDGTAMPPPKPQWTVTKGGQTWIIVRVETLQPAGAPVMFTLQLRGA